MAYTCSPTSIRSKFKYEFNWLIFLNDIIPILRRKLKIFSFFSVPFLELNNMYLTFLGQRCQTLMEITVNGQTIILERYLNMLFDNIDRGIIIENTSSNFETLYIYRKTEQGNVGDESFLYGKNEILPFGGVQPYLFSKEEVDLATDVIIKIPSALYASLNLEQVKAIVSIYFIAGIKYKIEQY